MVPFVCINNDEAPAAFNVKLPVLVLIELAFVNVKLPAIVVLPDILTIPVPLGVRFMFPFPPNEVNVKLPSCWF